MAEEIEITEGKLAAIKKLFFSVMDDEPRIGPDGEKGFQLIPLENWEDALGYKDPMSMSMVLKDCADEKLFMITLHLADIRNLIYTASEMLAETGDMKAKKIVQVLDEEEED